MFVKWMRIMFVKWMRIKGYSVVCLFVLVDASILRTLTILMKGVVCLVDVWMLCVLVDAWRASFPVWWGFCFEWCTRAWCKAFANA